MSADSTQSYKFRDILTFEQYPAIRHMHFFFAVLEANRLRLDHEMSLTLWYSPQACSIAPHILLIEAELDFQLVLAEVDMAQDERFTAEFKALNPKKRVPVFKMNDEIITEVPAIITAISYLAPDRGFLGKTTMDTVRVYEWLNYLGGVVHGQAYGGLYRPERLVDDPTLHAAVQEKALRNLEQAFVLIEQKLRSSGTMYAVGNSFTAADAYLFVLYRWAGAFIPGLKVDFPHLSAWASKLLERKAIIAAVEVHTGV